MTRAKAWERDFLSGHRVAGGCWRGEHDRVFGSFTPGPDSPQGASYHYRDGRPAWRDADGSSQPADATGRVGDGRAPDRARRERTAQVHVPGERRGAQAARAELR